MARTKNFSCQDIRLELPPNQAALNASALVLLGKLISSNPSSLSVVKDVVSKAWRPVFPMEVRRVEKEIYMFSFQHKADLQKVFRKIPWSIRGGHMVLKRWNPNLSWQEVDFFVSIFWVQVHRLPSLWLSENNLKKIGSLVGEVLEVDFIGDGGGFWKKFSRI